MDEATGDPSLQPRAGDGEKLQSSSSPVHESRLAALRRADNIVLQGGYAATSGLTSPTLLQRSNSNRTQNTGSPSSSRSDLSWPHSPHARSPEALDPPRGASPRFRSTSAQFTRANTLPRKGRARFVSLLKRGGFVCFVLLFLFFAMDWWFLASFEVPVAEVTAPQAAIVRDEGSKNRSSSALYDRLLALAAHGLAENELKGEPHELWEEPTPSETTWLPCANQRPEGHIPPPLPEYSNGYIMINANGDISQQRVAICNGVAVARMLNATLILPKFTFPNAWNDSSQFKDLYVEDYFIDYLKEDVRVVKELPVKLQSLDLSAIEAVVTEDDVPKEAKPSFYLQHILPVLLKTRVVLFEGFVNRLAFDPVPFEIQRLRCRCNFHALRFVPELQRAGSLLAQRMRDQHPRWGPGDDEFEVDTKPRVRFVKNIPKYVAIQTQFEVDRAVHESSCETATVELRAYLEEHLPLVEQDGKLELAELQGKLGVCPLLPEESFLILAGLGYKRATRIYLAGVHLHSWQVKMASLKFLYPNVVIKEDILTVEELQPFHNQPFQLAVLDFIACSFSDMFFMADSGNDLALLVVGHRMYHASGHAPTLHLNRKRVAEVFAQNATIEWSHFQEGVGRSGEDISKRRMAARPRSQSIYRHPRGLECMCEHHR